VSTSDQTDIFGAGEGDNWFRRNAASLAGAPQADPALDMLMQWSEREIVRSVCELGCSNGWRLAAIHERLPSAERLAGSDLSHAAIADGVRRWPQLELTVGSLDRPGIRGTFDVVIVSFVLHWVARERLEASVRAIDALVRLGGALIIADFLPDEPCARPYHHREDVEIFTYKQDYPLCFTALGTYSELERQIFSHSGAPVPIDAQDRAVCVLLGKGA
jgi:SAM-dependent methyltransferase